MKNKISLGNLITLEYGKGLPASKRAKGNFPVYGSNGIVGYHNEAYVKAGIVVGRKGSIGKTEFVDTDFWPIDTTYYITANSNYNLKWVYYLLQTLNLSALNRATGVPGLNRDDVYNINVYYPTIRTQQKIANILTSVDDAIEKTDQIIQKTEKLKKGLIGNLFSFRNEEDAKFMTLGDIGKVSMCKRIYKKETSDTGEIPFYKIGTFGKKPDAFISQDLFNNYRKKFSFPKVGDVLLSASGTIGRKIKYDGKPAYFQDSNIIWLEHDESKVLNDYLFYLYETIEWQTEGSTIKRLYNNILLKKRVPVPPIDNQERIVTILSSVDEKILSNKKLRTRLVSIKKGLMHDIFSQKVETN